MINVTFLGTASQIPTHSQNHTSIFLRYKGEGILVDCGEGTQRQFRIAKINMGKVTRILITHWHGDHVLGLPGLLSSLALNGYSKKLHIYGPKYIKEQIRDMLKVFGFKREYKIEVKEITKSGKFFDNGDFCLLAEKMQHGIPSNAYSFVKKGQIRIDKKKLRKFKIRSGKHLGRLKKGKDISFKGKKYKAKNLTYMDGDLKVSFVLDTKDNKKIVPFVKDSDLLICESSYSNDLSDQARKHLHLTSAQAGNIAKKSKSKKLILTHISQRYERDFNVILKEVKKIFKNAVVAKDFDIFEV